MPVYALFNLNDPTSMAVDSAPLNGQQFGYYINGATSVGGQAVLDGANDLVKIVADPLFQGDAGTLNIQFTLGQSPLTATQTVLSRDSVGDTAGGFRVEILPNGAVQISHETGAGVEVTTTEPGFAAPGEQIDLTYSWDQAGSGGQVTISNLTSGDDFTAPVSDAVTMDMGTNNQPYIIGAGQANSDPNALNNIDQHFQGTVQVFSLSDTVDNNTNDAPIANPDTAATAVGVPVTITVLGNDTDPNGDPLSILGTPTATNGTVSVNPNGTLNFTPTPGFTGTSTITYTITDGNGGTDTGTVTVTVGTIAGNIAPVANPDSSTTGIDIPVTVNVLGNDTDANGDPLSILGVPTSTNGTVTVNPDGTLRFVPTPGFEGTATITYTVTDGNGGTDTSTATIIVSNDTPDGIVRGTAGDDLINTAYSGDPDGDRIDANDAIIAGDDPQDDRVIAGDGNDTVRANEGDDSVEGGAGNDSLVGGVGNDSLYGQEGNDSLVGGLGNDVIDGGNGNDLANGGSGDDVINTSGSATPLPDIDYPGLWTADANPTNDLDTVYGGDGNDTISTGDDADSIDGGTGNDVIDGGIDADTIMGNQGNDIIIGAEGSDVIDAGQGDDVVYGGYGVGVPDAVNIPDAAGDLRPDNGRDDIRGGMGNDTIFGQDDDDTIDGGQDDDLIDGGVDDDLITGNTGNDTIIGGEGNDTMAGGNDRDVFLGANAGDVVDGNEGGDDFDTLNLSGLGPLNVVYDPTNAENGTVQFLDADRNVTGTMTFTNIENVIPCFTPGTMIATPRGQVPVESLRPGDKVVTRDNGLQEIRWTGSKSMSWADLAANPHMKPVLVKQGSLGNGLPERDMMVSPNHRLLVANDRTALYFDEHEVLVAAKHLAGSKGMHSVDTAGVTYIHFMFDRHEVVLSNGAWTESFQPGDYTLKGMGNAQRSEIFDLFPELKTSEGIENYEAARRTLKRHEAMLLVK